MVFITGDCHANYDKFDTKRFRAQLNMTKEDIVIVCGDFGLWHDDTRELRRLYDLSERPFTTVFVDGNHENFDRLYSNEFDVVDFHGGKAHQIKKSIYHLMRGHVFDFEGKKFFAFGGARSHDIQDGIIDRSDYPSDESFKRAIEVMQRSWKMFRINHVSWWKQEMPSEDEMKFGLETLSKCGNKVDYIISHCCPMFVSSAMGFKDSDPLTEYFVKVAYETEFKRWYFGHYHRNDTYYSKYVCLYDRIERIL